MRMITAVLIAAIALPVAAQDAPKPLVTYTEVTSDGPPHVLTLPKDRVVDINSRINLALDKAALDSKLAGALNLPGIDPSILARIDQLSKVLAARDASLKVLREQFSAAVANPNMTDAQRTTYFAAVQTAAAPIAELLNQPAPAGSILMQRRRFYLDHPPAGIDVANPADRYTIIFMAAADEAEKLQKDFEATSAQNGVYVQLGAWVQETPVHLEGFDAYPVGEHFVVERFNLALSDAQKKELADLAALSKKVNAEGISALLQWRAAGQALLNQAATNSDTGKCVKALQTQFNDGRKNITSAAQSLQTQYLDAQTAINDYIAAVNAIGAKYSDETAAAGMSPDQFLIQTNGDMVSLVGQTKALSTKLTNSVKTLTEIAKNLTGTAKTDITNLAAAAKSCADTAEADSKKWKETILSQINSLLHGSTLDREALQFGDEVTKLTLSDTPTSTFIPLTYTGKRQRGDALTVKLAAGTPKGPRVVLEEDDFVLYQTLPYIALKVGLIFARPSQKIESSSTTTTSNTTVRHFQTAPAYSVLLKKDSPTNMTWNTLWDPGVGLNVSALDFNHDDTPELGVGLVLSVIRDIVQVGYGYNVPLGKKYAYFGLRLPLPSFIAAGGPANAGNPPP